MVKLYIDPGQSLSAKPLMGTMVSALPLSNEFYAHNGNGDPAVAMLTAAAIFEAQPGLFDRFRVACGQDLSEVVAGWFAFMREVVFVDIDERVHAATRWRDEPGDAVHPAYMPLPQYIDLVAPMLASGQLMAGPGGNLPVMTEALLRLTRLSRGEGMLRRLMGGMGENKAVES